MIRIVIFDFDDTLIDNSSLDYRGFVVPCLKMGLPVPSSKKIFNLRKKRLLARDIVTQIHQHTKQNFSKQKFLALRKDFLESKESLQFLHLQKGAKTLLSFLKFKKIECFLCSVRKDKEIIKDFLMKNNIDNYFCDIYLINDLGINLENSNSSNRILIKSSIIHHVLKNRSLLCNEIIFIGNSKDDYEAAMSMHTIFINYKNSYLDELTDKGLIKVRNMTDLKKKISVL